MHSSIAKVSSDGKINDSALQLREKWINEIFDWLHGLSNIAIEQSREIEKLTGLSKNQALAIKTVSRSPSACVTELAKSMYLNPATMVRILDRLEELGLITRTRSKADRRVVKIGLTDKAQEIELTLQKFTQDSMMHNLEAVDEQEVLHMLEALQKFSSLFDAAPSQHARLRESDSMKGIN